MALKLVFNPLSGEFDYVNDGGSSNETFSFFMGG